MDITEYYSCERCGSPLGVKSNVLPNGVDIKTVVSPCNNCAAEHSVHWTAYAVIAAGLVLLGIRIGWALFGG